MIWAARAVVIAPHPDDETLGMGGHLQRIRDLTLIHVTDGAPFNMDDAHAHGFTTREEYARARRMELLAALALAGIAPERAIALQVPDQGVLGELPEVIGRLVELLRQIRPEAIFAPAYEGGHPDHDSTAFAVAQACAQLQDAPGRIEYALYHDCAGQLNTGHFLAPDGDVTRLKLDDSSLDLKRGMLDCFHTQRAVIAQFPVEYESFRPAPDYDFGAPPHAGLLWYERFNWGATGEQWRARIRSLQAC